MTAREECLQLRAWGIAAPDAIPRLRPEEGKLLSVNAPDGWKMDNHPHSMARVLKDARGFWRATYFVKQAAWDTRINLTSLERAVSPTLYRTTAQARNPQNDNRPEYLWEPRVVLGCSWILSRGTPGFFSDLYGTTGAMASQGWPDWQNFDARWDLPIPPDAEPHYVRP